MPALFAVACTETRRGLGEACLKGEDCTSGLCVAQQCAASPPVVQGSSNPTPDGSTSDATPPEDSGADVVEPIDAPNDTGASDAGDAAD